MGKIQVDVCLISGRGLRRTSPLWKFQWFAVGWIDPSNKYCTKIDTSGNVNPVWKTNFATTVDPSESELALHVEVYSREPLFLRESLLGSTTIVLKEFLDKYSSTSDVPKPVEEVGSFQLRRKNSNKPLGFVDVSIRVSEDREEPGSSYLGVDEGFNLTDNNGGVNLAANGYGSAQSYRPHPLPAPSHLTDNNGGINLAAKGYGSEQSYGPHPLPTPSQQPESSHQMPFPPNYPHHPSTSGPNYSAAGGLSYQPHRMVQPPPPPPPPPPPSNVGYIPNFFPMTSSYVNMPTSVGRGVGPGFGMGVGAGALAAGAVIFGDDFMSGFDIPASTISTYPAF